jgi:hypothetical protein
MQQGDKIEMEPLLLRLQVQVVIYLIPQVWKTCNHCSAKTSDDEGKKKQSSKPTSIARTLSITRQDSNLVFCKATTRDAVGSIGGTIKTTENYLILARNLA